MHSHDSHCSHEVEIGDSSPPQYSALRPHAWRLQVLGEPRTHSATVPTAWTLAAGRLYLALPRFYLDSDDTEPSVRTPKVRQSVRLTRERPPPPSSQSRSRSGSHRGMVQHPVPCDQPPGVCLVCLLACCCSSTCFQLWPHLTGSRQTCNAAASCGGPSCWGAI